MDYGDPIDQNTKFFQAGGLSDELELTVCGALPEAGPSDNELYI